MNEKYVRGTLLRNEFSGKNKWDIPLIRKQEIDFTKLDFLGFEKIGKTKRREDVNKTIHFFKEDKQFECVYNHRKENLAKLARFRAVLSPDFSLYSDMPLALQMLSTFKNRWCGAFWQSYDLNVIPTISWSDRRSYDFCFLGVEKRSTVAVSTVGNRRHKEDKEPFLEGYYEMLNRLEPEVIICYGKPFEEMKGKVLYVPCEEIRKGD